jgi:preprotein translocase subunit YajC
LPLINGKQFQESTESQLFPMSSQSILMTMVQAAPAGQSSGTAALLFQIFPILIIFVIFYVLWIRPQQRQVSEHRATIMGVKKGDDIVTGGGIRGRVTKVTDDEAEVEIAQGVKVRVVKSTISQIITPNAKPAND